MRSTNIISKENIETNTLSKPTTAMIDLELDDFPNIIEIEPVSEANEGDTKEAEKAIEKSYEGEGYETYEHIIIGDEGFQLFLDKLQKEDPSGDFFNLLPLEQFTNEKTGEIFYKVIVEENLKLPNDDKVDLKLSPGEIVALGGDFFGKEDEPISFGDDPDEKARLSIQQGRFINAFSTLTSPKHFGQIQAILKYVKEQTLLIHPDPNLAFQKKPDGTIASTLHYSWITSDSILPGDFCHNRYLALAANNFDHFGADAIAAFTAGLSLAIDAARMAKTMTTELEQTKLLRKAIAYVLYACHFLTDLYASGHVDTPRRQILNAITGHQLDEIPDLKNISSTKKMLAGMLAMKMHDESNKTGIWVKNDHEKWLAFGDHTYNHPDNKANAKKAAEAVCLALQDIFLVFTNNPQNQPLFIDTFKTIIPKADKELNAQQFPPLYRITEDKSHIEVRTENGYKPMHVASTLALFFKVKVKNTANEVKELAQKEVESFVEKILITNCRVM